jgi:hypothetical protein
MTAHGLLCCPVVAKAGPDGIGNSGRGNMFVVPGKGEQRPPPGGRMIAMTEVQPEMAENSSRFHAPQTETSPWKDNQIGMGKNFKRKWSINTKTVNKIQDESSAQSALSASS